MEEFKRATKEIEEAQNPREQVSKISVWQPIIAKYSPTLIGQCDQAITWSREMVTEWMQSGMFKGEADAAVKAKRIVEELGSHTVTKNHSRHIDSEKLKSLGVKIESLEDNQELQDAVLSVHHACIHTMTHTPAIKVIENQNRVSFIIAAQVGQR